MRVSTDAKRCHASDGGAVKAMLEAISGTDKTRCAVPDGRDLTRIPEAVDEADLPLLIKAVQHLEQFLK